MKRQQLISALYIVVFLSCIASSAYAATTRHGVTITNETSTASSAYDSFTLGYRFDASETLNARLPATSGGTDYQAYYDDVLDITWLADANLPTSNTLSRWRHPRYLHSSYTFAGVNS